ncbi:MAG: tripartite tricarboxylate transporter substrate binding protein [Acetobacteraceae bacterium]|nr:tripartite tricarboxylate transporter substrate binding protein [Acetobacteraceae bacterium]
MDTSGLPRRALLAVGLTSIAARTGRASANWRPDRPVRMIVPSGAGSGADVVARALAARLAEQIGQPVVVDNQPQGVGTVGILATTRARPDGQTIMCAISSILLAPLVDASLPYDVRNVTPVSQVHQAATVLCVPPRLPIPDLAAFVAASKAQPDRFTIGTYGHGTASHIHAALLIRRAGPPSEVIHFPSSPPMIRDMIAVHIRCGIVDSASGMPFFRDGALRPLAVSGRRRLSVLPDVPSFGELGYAGFEPAIWQAVFLPPGTPAPLAAAVEAEVRAAIASAPVSGMLRSIGFEPAGGSAAELAAMLEAERATWTAVIAETGIRPRT